MRRLRLVVSTSPALSVAVPTLLLATLLPVAAADCSRTPLRPGEPGPGAGGGGTATGQGAGGEGGSHFTASSSAGTGGEGGAGAGGGGGAVACEPGTTETTFTVDVPPEGTPATPGAICAVMMAPVTSNEAARVTLTKYSSAQNLAMGFIAIDPAVAGAVVGLPAIAAIEAGTPELLPLSVTSVQPTAGGFSFHAEWPPFTLPPEPWVKLTLRVTMQIACDPQMTDLRTVTSITYVHLCLGDGDLTWVSSGDECKACEIIAEMAPSPIVSSLRGDDLPLGRALRLRVSVLARIGRTLILLAENDGGPGLCYAWQPSGGEVRELAPDVVAWTLPESLGPHLIQAAAYGDDEAMVAGFTVQESA